jgi:hypothetical protein
MLLDEYLTGMSQNSSLIYMVNLARPVPETGIPVDTTEEVLKSQDVLNKKIADILSALEKMQALGKFPARIELGNEFYFHNDAAAIYAANPDLYLDHAAQLARAIRQKFSSAAYPPFKIAVIATKGGTASREKWNQAVFHKLETDAQFASDVDAVTMHWYISSEYGPQEDPVDAAGCMQMIAQAAKNMENQTLADYNSVPAGTELWSTEYGIKGTYQVGRGTWADGMRAMAMALNYFGMGKNMTSLAFQYIRSDEVIDDNNVVGPKGFALALLNRAARGKQHAENLVFSPNPFFVDHYPSLVGWKFWNDSVSACLIVNFSEKAIDTLDVSALFDKNDSVSIVQRYSRTPWQKGVNENNGISEEKKVLLPSVLHLPPFSVTYVKKQNAVLGIKTPKVRDNEGFRLFPNYPNPFRGKTTIAYRLFASMPVDLSVYDFTGKKVADIVKGMQLAGMYNVRFSAGNLSPGLYLYALHAGNRVATGKMILMKRP